jgi:nitrate/nitrite transporter NarK
MNVADYLKRDESKHNSRWGVALFVVLLAQFANAVPHFGIYPIISMIRDDLQLSDIQTSAFTGIGGIASILAVLPAAFLLGRFKLKFISAMALVLSVTGMALLLVAKSFSLALTGRFLWMFFYRIALVGCVSLVIAASPPSFKGRAMGLNGAFSGIGAALAAPVASYIAINYYWNSIFYLFIAVVILGAIVIMIWFKPYELSDEDHDGPNEKIKRDGIFTNSLVWVMVLVMFLFSSAYGTIQLISLFLKDSFNADPSVAVIAQSVGQILGIILIPVFGVITDKFGSFQTLLIVAACQFMTYMGMLSGFYTLFVVCCGALQFTALCGINMVYAAAPSLLHGVNVGGVTGIITLGTGVAQFLLPQIAAQIYVKSGDYFGFYLFLLSMSALAIMISVVLIKGINRSTVRDMKG